MAMTVSAGWPVHCSTIGRRTSAQFLNYGRRSSDGTIGGSCRFAQGSVMQLWQGRWVLLLAHSSMLSGAALPLKNKDPSARPR